MNGVINVLKPSYMTSHDVVAFLRRVLKTKKVGHTGTLDPQATGVLPICVGNATKLVEYLTSCQKKYRAELTLGIATDTQDSSGIVIEEKDVNLTEEKIIKAIHSFKGVINQVPPMYSALKVNGKKLYELAREGIIVERQGREIQIYNINILKINMENKTVLFDVECSKGTYIRTLCDDIGKKLGCGGHMSFLLRTKTGNFEINNSFTLDEISEYSDNSKVEQFMIPVDQIFSHLPKVTVKSESLKWVLNGADIYLKDILYDFEVDKVEVVKLYDQNGIFLALYSVVKDCSTIKLKVDKMFLG